MHTVLTLGDLATNFLSCRLGPGRGRAEKPATSTCVCQKEVTHGWLHVHLISQVNLSGDVWALPWLLEDSTY